MALTIVVEVVCGHLEGLEGTGEVEHVELVLEDEENVNGLLVGHGRRLVCSHREGCSWYVFEVV